MTGLGSAIETLTVDFRDHFHAKPYGKRMIDALFSLTIRLCIFR